MGKTRSKQLQLREGDYSANGHSRFGDKVLNVQVNQFGYFGAFEVKLGYARLTMPRDFKITIPKWHNTWDKIKS